MRTLVRTWCAQVREGIVPNEHGTWQYGRNGWCDGQQARPVLRAALSVLDYLLLPPRPEVACECLALVFWSICPGAAYPGPDNAYNTLPCPGIAYNDKR